MNDTFRPLCCLPDSLFRPIVRNLISETHEVLVVVSISTRRIKRGQPMKQTLIYDIPTRIFHWLFVALFLFSFLIAKNVDDESVLFSYHMISGILLTGIVLLRAFWGLMGYTICPFFIV